LAFFVDESVWLPSHHINLGNHGFEKLHSHKVFQHLHFVPLQPRIYYVPLTHFLSLTVFDLHLMTEIHPVALAYGFELRNMFGLKQQLLFWDPHFGQLDSKHTEITWYLLFYELLRNRV